MRPVPFSVGALLAAAVAILPGAAGATVMRYLSLPEHLGLSDLVVRARVGEARTFVGEGGMPFTDTELEVLEVLKGQAPAGGKLVVRQMKGEVDGAYRSVPGDAVLIPGEEVVLFLHGVEGGVAYLTALGQSKYKVERPVGTIPGPGDDGAVVVRDLSNLTFYLEGDRPALTHGDEEAPVDLRIFRETVRELAGEAR